MNYFGNAYSMRHNTPNTLFNANSIASNLKKNSQAQLDKTRLKKIKREVKKMKQTCSIALPNLTRNFEFFEIEIAIKDMKSGKAARLDGIFMEFIKNFEIMTKT